MPIANDLNSDDKTSWLLVKDVLFVMESIGMGFRNKATHNPGALL